MTRKQPPRRAPKRNGTKSNVDKPHDADLIRVREVVERTGKSKATVYRWIGGDDPKVRSTKIGNEVYVYRSSLAEFLGPDARKLGIVV